MKLKSFVVIEDEDEFLLVQERRLKWRGQWYFPGGQVKSHEDPVVALQRETMEEAGCHITLSGIFYICHFHSVVKADQLIIYYIGKTTDEKIKTKADRHSLGAKWFSYEEILHLPLRENALEVINAYRARRAVLPLHYLCLGKR